MYFHIQVLFFGSEVVHGMLFCYLEFCIAWTRTLKLQIWSIPSAGTAWPEHMRVCSASAVLGFWQDNCQHSGSNDVSCVCVSQQYPVSSAFTLSSPFYYSMVFLKKVLIRGTSITFTLAQNTSGAVVALYVVDSVSFSPALKYLEARYVAKISGTFLWPRSSYVVF